MKKSILTSAAAVEAAFYDALARRDVDAMMSVWSEDDEVLCILTDGIRLTDLAAIRDYWQNFFETLSRDAMRVTHRVSCANMMLTVFSNLETTMTGNDTSKTVFATHVYSRGALGWRLVMRHASHSSQEPPPQGPSSVVH